MGFPTETVAEINMTIRFACQTDLDEALFSIVRKPCSVAYAVKLFPDASHARRRPSQFR